MKLLAIVLIVCYLGTAYCDVDKTKCFSKDWYDCVHSLSQKIFDEDHWNLNNLSIELLPLHQCIGSLTFRLISEHGGNGPKHYSTKFRCPSLTHIVGAATGFDSEATMKESIIGFLNQATNQNVFNEDQMKYIAQVLISKD